MPKRWRQQHSLLCWLLKATGKLLSRVLEGTAIYSTCSYHCAADLVLDGKMHFSETGNKIVLTLDEAFLKLICTVHKVQTKLWLWDNQVALLHNIGQCKSSSGVCRYTGDGSHSQIVFHLRGAGQLCTSLQHGSILVQSAGLFIIHRWKEQGTADCTHFCLANLETVIA